MRCSPTTSSAASISLSTTPKRSRNRTTSSRSKRCSSLRSCTRASPTWKSSPPAVPRNCCWCTRKKTRNWTPNASGSSSRPSTRCGETRSGCGRMGRSTYSIGEGSAPSRPFLSPSTATGVASPHLQSHGAARDNNARVHRQHRARGLRVYGTTVGTGVLVDGPFEIRRLHFLQELLKLFHLVIEGFLQGDRLLGDRIRNEDGGFHPQRERYRIAWTGVDHQRGAVRGEVDFREVGALFDFGDHHARYSSGKRLEDTAQEVVGHGAGRFHPLQLHRDRRRFRLSDPDRQRQRFRLIDQQDDWIHLLVECDSPYLHVYHGRPSSSLPYYRHNHPTRQKGGAVTVHIPTAGQR